MRIICLNGSSGDEYIHMLGDNLRQHWIQEHDIKLWWENLEPISQVPDNVSDSFLIHKSCWYMNVYLTYMTLRVVKLKSMVIY